MNRRWTIQDIERLNCKKTEKDSAKPKKNISATSANVLTKQALRMLDLKGYQVWRQNNGGVYDPTLKVFRSNSSTPGISDIIGFHRKTSRFLACEIKAGKDRLSDEQELFLENVRKAGGIALVIRTNDDIESLSKSL